MPLSLVLIGMFRQLIIYKKIQYKNEYYYSGINPIEFRGHSKSYVYKQMKNNFCRKILAHRFQNHHFSEK